MSASASQIVVASPMVHPARVERETENLEPPAPWTVTGNEAAKIGVRTQWVEAFQANVGRVAASVATSIYNNFSRHLDEATKNGFMGHLTRELPFSKRYVFSLPVNGAQMQKWAGATAQLAPFNEWFTQYVPPEKKEGEAPVEAPVRSLPQGAVDHAFIGSMISTLGQRVRDLVKERFDLFTQGADNKGLVTQVKWNSEEKRSFLSSKGGSSYPTLHVSAWLDEASAARLRTQDATLLQRVATPVDGSAPLHPPGPGGQAVHSSRLWSALSSFFAKVGGVFASLFSSIRSLCRRT